MSLFNTYTAANRDVTAALDTSWRKVLVESEWHLVEGTGGGYHVDYWKYYRTRTKSFSYVGLTREAAKECAAAMHALFNRRFLPQSLDMQTSTGVRWIRPANPLQQDYEYVDACKVNVQKVSGDDWSVTVEVDETLEYKHTPQISSQYGGRPSCWVAFEADPSNSEFDSYFTGIAGRLDYGEDEDEQQT